MFVCWDVSSWEDGIWVCNPPESLYLKIGSLLRGPSYQKRFLTEGPWLPKLVPNWRVLPSFETGSLLRPPRRVVTSLKFWSYSKGFQTNSLFSFLHFLLQFAPHSSSSWFGTFSILSARCARVGSLSSFTSILRPLKGPPNSSLEPKKGLKSPNSERSVLSQIHSTWMCVPTNFSVKTTPFDQIRSRYKNVVGLC